MQRGGNLNVAVAVGPAGHGGISTYCRELVVALCRRDDLHVIVIGSPAAIEEIEVLRGEALPDRIALRGPRAFEQFRVASLSLALRRRGVDVVHGTRHVLPLFWPGASVLTFHDDFLLTRRSDYDVVKRCLLPPIFRRSVRRADVIALPTVGVADSARALAGPECVLVETGAAMSTQMASATAIRPANFASGRRYALVVGDAGRRKRVDRLVDVWQQLGSDVSLVVAGGRAAAPELLAQIARSDRVHLVSAPTDGELAWLYRHADLVVDASDEEGFGFPRVEAAAFGAPYVALREAPVTNVDASWVAYLRDRIDDTSTQTGSERTHADTTDRQLVTWDDVAEATVAAYRTALEVSGSGEAGRMRR